MKKYVARFERDENDYWSVVVQISPKVSAVSDGQTLQKARRRIRWAVAELLQLGEDEFELLEELHLGSRAKKALSRLSSAKMKLESTRRETNRAQAEAAQVLVDLGISRSDAGELLGITKQRVQQLLSQG